METVGSLVDKISIINIKIYHQEDIAHEPGASDKLVADAKRAINVLNNQRCALVQELDELIASGKMLKPYEAVKDYGKKG